MKQATIAAVLAIAVGVSLFIVPRVAGMMKEPEKPKLLSERQEMWLDALAWCESKGVDTAVNPKDRDGTPSYGRYQFKPSTYAYYAEAYGMASTSDYMNAAAQRDIVSHMIVDPSTVWEQQFPDCVKRVIGRPPKE